MLEFKGIKDAEGKFYRFKKPNAKRKLPKYLTQDEIRVLVKSARDFRDYAMLAVFCTAGTRLMDLVMLNIEDIDFTRKQIRIKHAKFDKEREVPLADECGAILRQYIESYHGPKAGPRAPLFKSARGTVSPFMLLPMSQ